jgi:hypothetical protein
MSGSTKPSPSAGSKGLAVEVEIPAAVFFAAKDYNAQAERTKGVLDTQAKVAAYRAKKKQEIRLSLDDLDRINSGSHAADRQGNLAAHWDSMIAAAARLHTQIVLMGRQIDAADDRFEASLQAPPPSMTATAQPGAVVPPVLHSVKPAPESLAAQVRRRS